MIEPNTTTHPAPPPALDPTAHERTPMAINNPHHLPEGFADAQPRVGRSDRQVTGAPRQTRA